MKISIDGIGVVGGFGCGVTDLGKALPSQMSPLREASFETANGTVRIPAYLADTSSLEEFVHKRSLRRIDHYSRMALLGAYLALQDAGMPDLNNQRVGLVVTSGYGATRTTFSFLDSAIEEGDSYASPTLFSNSVHNAAAGHISILLKLHGPTLTVSQFEMSVPSALLSASQWLEQGRVNSVLLGAVDEFCDVLGYCWMRFFGEDNKSGMTPLEFDRQSAIPGEGAVFFLLSRDKEDSTKYGFIKDLQIGYLEKEEKSLPKDAIFILGADGHKECGAYYERFIDPGIEVASYSSLYGSLPIGPAFDMAIAALSIKEDRIFASPVSSKYDSTMNVVREDKSVGSKSICCLKIGREGEFGNITLASK